MEKEIKLYDADSDGYLNPQTLLDYVIKHGKARKTFNEEIYTMLPIYHPILYYGIYRHTIDAYFTADKKGLYLAVTHRSNGKLKITGLHKIQISNFRCFDYENSYSKNETNLISFKIGDYDIILIAEKNNKGINLNSIRGYVNRTEHILSNFKSNLNQKLVFTDQEN